MMGLLNWLILDWLGIFFLRGGKRVELISVLFFTNFVTLSGIIFRFGFIFWEFHPLPLGLTLG